MLGAGGVYSVRCMLSSRLCGGFVLSPCAHVHTYTASPIGEVGKPTPSPKHPLTFIPIPTHCPHAMQVETYLSAMRYPYVSLYNKPKFTPTIHSRGGYPVRDGARNFKSLDDLVDDEVWCNNRHIGTQAIVQFETGELIFDTARRDAVLDLMAAEGQGRCIGFVGAMDARLRSGDNKSSKELDDAIDALGMAALDRGIVMGKLCGGKPGPGGIPDPKTTQQVRVRGEHASSL